MQATQFSRTAQVMALFRALETARPASRRLLNDPFATGPLPVPFKTLLLASRVPPIRHVVNAVIDRMWPGARTSGIARTRLIDDWLRQALGQGSRQLVILGAGFDFRAWRLPELAAAPVYEVDHPATAAEKRRLILQYGLDPSRIAQAAIDLDQESVAEGLERHGFDPHRRTIVLWEGVSQYLSEAAVDAVLAWAASLAPGSLLAFTYVHENLLRNPASFENAAPILQAAAKAGEPWCFGIDPALLATWLRKSGLELLQDLGADEYRARYAAPGISAWRGYAFYRAALARVAANA